MLMKKIYVFFTSMVLLLLSLAAAAQTISVRGTVKDANGEGVPSASVILQGSTTVYAMTDISGAFSIRVPSNGTLVVSCVGFQTQEVPVNGRSNIEIVLDVDSQLLDETIVVAFGTTTKEAFTGSATVVKTETLERAQVSAVTSALAGQVAGVQLTASSGAPGSTPSIRIRGFSSISAGKEPLYVVDGMPYDGDINNINPNDVESMTVLKDAAANALYGARGANGVIIINTKRAKAKDAVVTFDAKFGINQRAIQSYEYITDPAEYYETHYTALYNYYRSTGLSDLSANAAANGVITGSKDEGGLAYQVYKIPEGQSFIGVNGKINPEAEVGNVVNYNGVDFLLKPDDWMAAAYRQSTRKEYNLSVSAAHDKGAFYASLGYLSNEGITYNSDMKRLTSRLKADYQAKKWLKVSGNMNYTNFNYNSLSNNGTSNSTANIWAFTSQMAPIYPLYLRDTKGENMIDENGFVMLDYGDGMNGGLSRPFMTNANPLFANKVNTNNSEGNAFGANGAADFTFLKWFTFTVNAGVTVDESRGTTVQNPYYGQFASSGGSVGKSHSRSFAFNTQQLLNFNNRFDKIGVNVMLGHEYYDNHYAYLYGAKQKMFSQENKELAGAVVDNQNAYSYTSQYNNEGYFFRTQLDYDSKVYLSGSFRRDASSRFHPQHRWGNFWSVGGGWIISKENWFNAPWVDELKLKASVGSQGNDNISNYLYTDLFGISPLDGEISVAFSDKGKEDITWETNTNMNAGLEFSFFRNRLSGSFEFFNRKTTDMLFNFSVAPSLGYTGFYDNIGDMRNHGLEFSLTGYVIDTRDMHLAINLNATRVRNKILYLADDVKTKTVEGYDGYDDGSYFIGEGLPLYTRYMRKFAGVDPKTGESLWYKDIEDEDGNVTGQETTTDYSKASYYLGANPIPDLYGGFGVSFDWKGIDFAINCSYQIGGKSYDSGYAMLMSAPSAGQTGTNYHKDVHKAWSAENPSSSIPRFQYNDVYVAGTSDRFLTDASYLNIENINVGYTFPSKWTSKIGIAACRLYAACENVGYISARKGFDPRYSFSGATNYSTYLPIRTISGGITLKF